MNGITELAKLFKERDNPSIQGISIGKVLAETPLKITVNSFILEGDNLIIAEHLLPHKRETTATATETIVGDHGRHSHDITDVTFTDGLKTGDKVIVMPSTDNAIYFVVGKVV